MEGSLILYISLSEEHNPTPHQNIFFINSLPPSRIVVDILRLR